MYSIQMSLPLLLKIEILYPRTKFESAQKRDASEFIPRVAWMGL